MPCRRLFLTPPSRPLPPSMLRFLPPRLLATTDSTQERAREAAEAGAPEGFAVQALTQTAGRGRRGRVWDSPPGNLYLSVVVRPSDGNTPIGTYSFAAALAVHAMIRAALPAVPPEDVRLKWPNDALIRGRKVAGVLGETAGEALILGFGVNRIHALAQALFPATTLRAEAGDRKVPALESLCEDLLRHLAFWITRLRTEGFAPLRTAWNARALTGLLTVRDSTTTLTGISEGLAEDGRLVLRDAEGSLHHLSSGDVGG